MKLQTDDILLLTYVQLKFEEQRKQIIKQGYWIDSNGDKKMVADNEGYAPTELNMLLSGLSSLLGDNDALLVGVRTR